MRQILKSGPPQKLINAYGTTEAGIMSTYYEITGLAAAAETIPIGRPVSNVRLYLLDSNTQPVPIGVTGEIYIGGDIGRGYLRRAALTAEKFVPDFISGIPGAKLYRTGDRARLRADGNFEFVGRIDRQAKIRGYRIELDSVQQALSSHPNVRQAFVTVREDQTGYKRLVAWVVPKDGLAFASHALRTYVQSRLPEFMAPAAIIAVDSLPLTRNGKVNAAALPDLGGRPKTNGFAPPETDFERGVAELWQRLLSLESVGRDDNFFELGGDSLLGMRLMVSIRDTFGIEVSLRSLFETGTLWEFCASICPSERDSGRLQLVAPPERDDKQTPAGPRIPEILESRVPNGVRI